MTQLLEAKWREFQDGNPVTKDEEDQEEDGDSPEEEKQGSIGLVYLQACVAPGSIVVVLSWES